MNPLTALSEVGSRNDSRSHLCLAFIEIVCYDDVTGDVMIKGIHLQNWRLRDWLFLFTQMHRITLCSQ